MIHHSTRNLGEVFHLDSKEENDDYPLDSNNDNEKTVKNSTNETEQENDIFHLDSVEDDGNAVITNKNEEEEKHSFQQVEDSSSFDHRTSEAMQHYADDQNDTMGGQFANGNDDAIHHTTTRSTGARSIGVRSSVSASGEFSTDDSYSYSFTEAVLENAMYPSSRALVIPERVAEEDTFQNSNNIHNSRPNSARRSSSNMSSRRSSSNMITPEDSMELSEAIESASSEDEDGHNKEESTSFYDGSQGALPMYDDDENDGNEPAMPVDLEQHPSSSLFPSSVTRRLSANGSEMGGPNSWRSRLSSNGGGGLTRRTSTSSRRSSARGSFKDRKGPRVSFPGEEDEDEEVGNDSDSYSSRINNNNEYDFEKDPIHEMTGSRQLALKLLHKKWYNPLAGTERKVKLQSKLNVFFTQMDLPSLSKGWAYFEHVVLSRYVVMEHNVDTTKMTTWQKFKYSFKNYDEELERAQPGEKKRKTRLYDPIATPHIQLGDFGMGFGLYFSTLRAIGYICLAAGLMSLYSFYYYASDEYFYHRLSNPLLRGSAVCTKFEFVPCIDCLCNDRDAEHPQGWFRAPERCKRPYETRRDDLAESLFWPTAEDYESALKDETTPVLPANTTLYAGDMLLNHSSLVFTLKNRCLQEDGVLLRLGLINFGLMIVLFLSMFALGSYLEDQAVKFDEDEQTAQDYSIMITNPPAKATDPEDWKRFFEENFDGVKVATITCAVNNDLLVKALVARRETLRKLELCLDKGTPMDIDHLALMAAKQVNTYGIFHLLFHLIIPAVPELLSRLVSLNTRIKGLAQLSYPCTNVYVVFETERDQRYVLSKLAVGDLHVWRNNQEALSDKKYLFQGRYVLNGIEAVEPNTVRWQDLNVGYSERMQQIIMSNTFTIAAIFVCGVIVTYADWFFGSLGAAFSIAVLNLGFPEAAKLITKTEAHPTESHVQLSLYTKIAAFRWSNTAIVITFITPFTRTLSDQGLIPQIYAIFFAEIVTTNIIQLTDVWGHFQRHVLAPRASSQDTMNLFFQGLEVELAERYTNMTKIMFLAFWYCSIFPGAFFMSAIALCVNYYTDRFSLMRSWKRSPHVSTEISQYSRKYFFSLACIFLAVMSSFYWAAYPFDNLCRVEGPVGQNITEAYSGLHFLNTTDVLEKDRSEYNIRNVTVGEDTVFYRYCNQDFILRPKGFYFPFTYREGPGGGEWMTEDQKKLSIIYGWASVAILVLTAGKFILTFLQWVRSLFVKEFDARGDDQGIKFHDVRNISGYIPQVRSGIFSYPLIVCRVDKLDETIFDWTDPDRDFEYYDLTKDADHVLTGTNRRAKHSFSRCKHWPPNRRETLRKKKRDLEKRMGRSISIFNSASTHESKRISQSSHSSQSKSRSSSRYRTPVAASTLVPLKE